LVKNRRNLQKFKNGEVHNWYNIVLGFSDKLVTYLLERNIIDSCDYVLDPFCGTGTTLVECKKRGLKSIGIDANPSSVFASRVKTNWTLDPTTLRESLLSINDLYRKNVRAKYTLYNDKTFEYINSSGMLERGWISRIPLVKSIALKLSINELEIDNKYKEVLTLSLLSEVVNGSSNVRFGPELYCSKKKTNPNVFGGFTRRVNTIINDLKLVGEFANYECEVIEGDARICNRYLKNKKIALVISSPPYPTEHDYTRNSRLELAFLESVFDRDSLRSIKDNMLRSHTKGLYKRDDDEKYITDIKRIDQIIRELEIKVKEKKHGFARLYPKVVKEYFGGMARHLYTLYDSLEDGAVCAYVVGDQSSYLQVHIPTAEILSAIAKNIGYNVVGIDHWRDRWSTTTAKKVKENILILRK